MRGQRDDGDMARLARRLQAPRRLPAVQDRQAQVHEDECRQLAPRRVDPLRAVAGDHHLVALAPQPAGQHEDVVLVVLDIEYLRHSRGLPALGVARPACRATSGRSVASRSSRLSADFRRMRTTPPRRRSRASADSSAAVTTTTGRSR